MSRSDAPPSDTPTSGSASDPLGRFEAAMQELESIVERMEAGELTLEASLGLFERGMLLSADCRKSLDSAELRLRNLLDGEAPG